MKPNGPVFGLMLCSQELHCQISALMNLQEVYTINLQNVELLFWYFKCLNLSRRDVETTIRPSLTSDSSRRFTPI